MSAEAGRAVALGWFGAWQDEHPEDRVAEYYAADFSHHGAGGEFRGLEPLRQYVASVKVAFPDVAFTVEGTTAEEDQVAVRWTARGTHRGAFMGCPATGKAVVLGGTSVIKVASGKFVEAWEQSDGLGLVQQIAPASQAEANKSLLRRWVEEGWNQGRALKILEEIYAREVVFVGDGQELHGHGPVRQFVRDTLTGFPDFHNQLDDLIAEGDKVVSRHTLTGTHRGPFMGVPATGRQVRFTGITISRVRDGRIVEAWQNSDIPGLRRALGQDG